LRDNISFFSPDEPTCQLFTGHIGCGKSTELLQLKLELKQDFILKITDTNWKPTLINENQLDLVLQIFVTAGIVVLIPTNPEDRYQLVHDYLATFI
jgi:hypothetical protein